MILIITVVLGIFLGLLVPYNLNSDTLPYVAIALVAALDSVVGGIYSYLKKRFNIQIFISGFFSNAILAAILTFFGNKLGINLSFAVIVVFGTRIFNNSSDIRHLLLDKVMMESERSKRQRERREMLRIESVPASETEEKTEEKAEEKTEEKTETESEEMGKKEEKKEK